MVEDGAEFWRLDKGSIGLLPDSLKVIVVVGGGVPDFDWAEPDGRRGPTISKIRYSSGIWYCNAAGTVDEATFDIVFYLIIVVFRLASSGESAA